MDLGTMITEARLIFGQPDSSNSNFTDAQLTSWANEWYRKACVTLRSIPITENVMDIPSASNPVITLDAGVVAVDRAKIYIRPTNRWEPLKIIDLDELYVMDSNWENATVGEPTHLVKTGVFTMRLYPPPNTSNAGQVNSLKTHGLEIPTALSSVTDIPDLPTPVHDLFPNYIAHKAFMRLENGDRSAEQLLLANNGLKAMKSAIVNYSKSRGWRWPGFDGPQSETIPH